MSIRSKQELVAVLRPRYRKASRPEKTQILDELVATTGYHRKYAIQVLNGSPARRAKRRRKRPRKYDPTVVSALEQVWRVSNYLCSKRLVPLLPDLVDALQRHGELWLDHRTKRLLLEMSPATVDRLLRPARQRLGRRWGRSTTKPGTLLKHSIPLRTFADWDDAQPGFTEVDLVAHCGISTRGEFVHSLDLVDVATRWTECVAIPNRSQLAVTKAVEQARQRLPFPLIGLDSDNGAEFINDNFKRYCEAHHITFTRSRPYKKNDQAYVEQKNWTNVRQLIGYERYEGQAACAAINQLYEICHLYCNFFQTVMVLVSKERHGAKVTKRYDQAKTPYHRVLDHPAVPETVKIALRRCYLSLNPAALQRQIEAQQEVVWRLAISVRSGYHSP